MNLHKISIIVCLVASMSISLVASETYISKPIVVIADPAAACRTPFQAIGSTFATSAASNFSTYSKKSALGKQLACESILAEARKQAKANKQAPMTELGHYFRYRNMTKNGSTSPNPKLSLRVPTPTPADQLNVTLTPQAPATNTALQSEVHSKNESGTSERGGLAIVNRKSKTTNADKENLEFLIGRTLGRKPTRQEIDAAEKAQDLQLYALSPVLASSNPEKSL